MNFRFLWPVMAALLTVSGHIWADDGPSTIEATIKKLQPNSEILTIKESPVPGLYEVTMKDFDPVYMSQDGRYFMSGQMMQMTPEGRVVNLTEEKQRKERTEWLQKVPTDDQIVFAPAKGKAKAKVYVFTDVDCAYCRKFHTEMADYNAMGVEVHYLAYPRGGADSEAATKMQSIWCAKDRRAALTKVKAGGEVPANSCSNPVGNQYNLGKSVGVKGTPAVFTEDGTQIGGYLTPEQMKKALRL